MNMDPSGQSAAAPSDATGTGASYTCPMHAEIKRSEPGNCPMCGMTLVAKPTAQDRAQ